MAKGDDAPDAFVPNIIDMNVGRQRRILGNSYHCLRAGAHLLYSTCTFSLKENERVIEWFIRTHPEMEIVEVPALAEFQSKYTESNCYRLFPHQGLGAGAFVCLMRRKGVPPDAYTYMGELPYLWKYGAEVFKILTPAEKAAAKAAEEAAKPKPPVKLTARQIVKKMNMDKVRPPQVKKPRKRRK